MLESFDESLVVPCVLGVLGCNVLCVVGLLCLRPSAGKALRGEGKPVIVPALRALVAELVGTFAVVFVGMLAVRGGGAPGGLVVALAYGLVVAGMMAGLGALSGGHFNPAVTLGLVAVGRLHPLLGVGYWLAQMGGAAGAASLLMLLFGPAAVGGAVPSPAADVPLHAAVLLEVVATFFLVLVLFGTAVDPRGPKVIAPLAVGLTAAVGVLAVGPLSGGALNPARYFGPALAAQDLQRWVVYLAGPCLGGCIAAVLMQFVLLEEEPAPPRAEEEEGDDILELPPRRSRRSA
jgi:glycerol uptake facilitator-like aquaporin